MAKADRTTRLARLIGPIGFLGLLFLSSALIRVVIGATAVFAEMTDGAENAHVEASGAPNPEQDALLCQTDADLQRVLDALLEREEKLKVKQAALDAREAEVSDRMTQAEERLRAASEAEASLKATMALADSASENDLAQLTAVYQQMKPKKAAVLFEAMKPEFSAGFISRMTPEAAAAILAELSPEVAYSVSAVIAGRNANAGHAALRPPGQD